MKRWLLPIGVSTLLLLVALLLLLAQHEGRTDSADSALPQLEVVRLRPAGEPGSDIECASFAHVDFTYKIVNRGSRPISGLKLGLSCGCEALGTPPTTIPPGESARVSFRLQAPRAGVLRRQIPLLAEGSSEPLLALKPVLRVKFHPPELLGTPAELILTYIKGDDSPRELTFEAIERKQNEHWIRGLKLTPDKILEVVSLQVDELPEADPALARRRYRFEVANRSAKVGQRFDRAALRMRPDTATRPDPARLVVKVLDSVAIVPNPLLIRSTRAIDPRPRRVQLVYRTGQGSASVVQCDERLLRVQPLGDTAGRVMTFGVGLTTARRDAFQTHVVFGLGNGDTRDLTVRFEPPQGSQGKR